MKYICTILLILSFMIIGCCWAVDAAVPNQEKILMLLDSDVSGSEYVFSAFLVPQHNGENKQVFEIRCTTCAKHELLHEDTLDYPISIYRTSDNSTLFFTLWTTGSAYRMRVFNVDGENVRSVLDVGSAAPPQVGRNQSGRAVVTIFNHSRSGNSSSPPAGSAVIYQWNGSEFRMMPDRIE